MIVTTTPQQIGDGTRGLLISLIDNAQSSNEFLQFAFGTTAPTEWHKFYQSQNDVLEVDIGLGPIWVKVPSGELHIIVTIGA